MEFLNNLLDMMKAWPPFGQGLFLLLVLLLLLETYSLTFRYVIALFRGWPPVYETNIEHTDDD